MHFQGEIVHFFLKNETVRSKTVKYDYILRIMFISLHSPVYFIFLRKTLNAYTLCVQNIENINYIKIFMFLRVYMIQTMKLIHFIMQINNKGKQYKKNILM